MPSRFAIIAVLLISISPIPASHAQQITSDVVISGSTFNDGYMNWAVCDSEGQIYRGWGDRRENAVQRVARDGSTLRFTLPASDNAAGVFAPVSQGLAILNSSSFRGEDISYRMYRFDAQGNIVTRRPVSIDFRPTIMTATSSRKMIVVGHRPQNESWVDSTKYGGAVLDADDQVVQLFEFPPAPAGGKWVAVGPRMAGGDGVAYVILVSGAQPTYALATISESGHVDINVLKVPPKSDTRHHNEWLFGPGVAVEVYHFAGEKPHVKFRFDEYDLTSGKMIRTRSTRGAGFVTGCYSGDEISYLAHSAHVEKARGLSPETLRFVTVKLEESKPAEETQSPSFSSPPPAVAR
jgi:hypothetical protein